MRGPDTKQGACVPTLA